MNTKPVLGILLGDATGIGPELVAKLAAEKIYSEYCKPVIIGDARVLQQALELIKQDVPFYTIDSVKEADWEKGLPVIDMPNQDPNQVIFGKASPYCGKACIEMLEKGVQLFKEGEIDGFCFAPLNKSAMIQAGCRFESEHHLLANLFGHEGPFGEVNVLEKLWTTRTTSHIAIKDVSQNLTIEKILRSLTLANTTLISAGIEKPRIGVAALNPHAGEDGLCGTEELEVIKPAIEQASQNGICADGPYPADILFIKAFNGDFDGVVTMYHDQGQIALKLKGFDQGITIAGGLPAPIATCAHGTAYDIAGKGIAHTSAFKNAIIMASTMANNLLKEREAVTL